MSKEKQDRFMTTLEVIHSMEEALKHRKALSVVRVGDGENICLAQYKVWPIKKILTTRWARLSRRTNWKGVRLPNVKLRDQLVVSINRADIVGIPYRRDKEILAKQKYLRPLTDRCFERYGIQPKRYCHTFVNRHMVEYEDFWNMLSGKKIAIISRWAGPFKKLVDKKYGNINISVVKTLRLDRYEDIPKVIKKMESVDCDLVFISAGVNACIVAERLASEQGRIAIDFGKSAIFMLKGNRKVRAWKPKERSKQT